MSSSRRTVGTASAIDRGHDVFGKLHLAEGKYLAGQIDVSVWAEEIETDYRTWCAAQGLSVRERYVHESVAR
jgi:hypothetical protein